MPVGISIGILGASTVAQVAQTRKAQKATEKAAEVTERKQKFETARQKRKQIRQARYSQAQVQAQAYATGTAQTSKTSSISGNIRSESTENLSFLDTSTAFASAIGAQNIKASKARARGQVAGAVGSLASSTAGLFDKPE